MFSQSIFTGLNGAIATLVSQAHGSNNHYLCGVYLNRGRLVAVLIFIPMAVLLLYSEELLLSIGQDP